MLIDLATLDRSFPNICSIPASPEADVALARSIAKKGILQSVLVRPFGNVHQLIFGNRRVDQALVAGLTETDADVRVMTDREALEAQVIENMHRRSMHPVDRWKAAARMLAAGETLTDAAIALGFTEREVRQMERLSALHPKVLDLVIRDMPELGELKDIANAAPERQVAALRAQYAVQGDEINWYIIAGACRETAIPRGRAIFDLSTSNVPFEEDLFAQPGAADQFVTHDIARFIAAQKAALAARIEAGKKKNERLAQVAWQSSYPHLKLPHGYTRQYGTVASRPPKGATGPTKFLAVAEGGHDIGNIIEVVADPPAQIARQDAAALALGGTDALRSSTPLAANAGGDLDGADAELERAPMTNRGRQLVAAVKTEALAARIREHGKTASAEMLGACLVVVLSSNNVSITQGRYSGIDFDDLAARLVDPMGRLSVDDHAVPELLAEALARILVITDPVTDFGSGAPAEWIGNALHADEALPRFDTAELLATISRTLLTAIAREADVAVPGKVSALRESLAGHAPKFRPTTFGAPGPKPQREIRRRREEQEEDALA